MYRLENAITKLVDRLVDGIVSNGSNLDNWEIEALSEHATKEASDLATAIRETIAAEIAAAKMEK